MNDDILSSSASMRRTKATLIYRRLSRWRPRGDANAHRPA
jgi:hypothetical protein